MVINTTEVINTKGLTTTLSMPCHHHRHAHDTFVSPQPSIARRAMEGETHSEKKKGSRKEKGSAVYCVTLSCNLNIGGKKVEKTVFFLEHYSPHISWKSPMIKIVDMYENVTM